MFATIGRSWEFAKISYGIIWDFKSLMVFPILSLLASAIVLFSFVGPLWATGTLQHWLEFMEPQAQSAASPLDQVGMWVTLFLFYFCSYFVIIFFNAGLIACAMAVIRGEVPTVGYGLSMAGKRIPQILAWAFVAALVGVLIKAIENAHEKAGRVVAAILGSAWTALTYFIVPVIVMDGVGPVMAFKISVKTLKDCWGTALVGHFSLGFLAFLITLPVMLILLGLGAWAISAESMVGLVLIVIVGIVLITFVTAFTSAADVVFKAVLYNYATGRDLSEQIDTSSFEAAFAPK